MGERERYRIGERERRNQDLIYVTTVPNILLVWCISFLTFFISHMINRLLEFHVNVGVQSLRDSI